MATYILSLRIEEQPDDALDHLTAEKLQAALARAWPLARTSGIHVENFRELADRPGAPRVNRLDRCAVCGEVAEHVIHEMDSVPSGRECHAFIPRSPG